MNKSLYKILFNDGKVKMLVATDLSYKECEDLIQKQEKSELYHITEITNDFNYYSFTLNNVERIYYTYISNDNEQEILEWAERFGFIEGEDFEKCTNIRQIPQEEVDKRNKELYRVWWDEHKNDNPAFSRGFPPTIGEVQLN